MSQKEWFLGGGTGQHPSLASIIPDDANDAMHAGEGQGAQRVNML